MIDTGASVNLIRRSMISSHVDIDIEKVLLLKGITRQSLTTLGKVMVNIFDTLIEFHLVDDAFPIREDGILGTDFFRKTNAKINYSKDFIEIKGEKYYFDSDMDTDITDYDNLIGVVDKALDEKIIEDRRPYIRYYPRFENIPENPPFWGTDDENLKINDAEKFRMPIYVDDILLNNESKQVVDFKEKNYSTQANYGSSFKFDDTENDKTTSETSNNDNMNLDESFDYDELLRINDWFEDDGNDDI